MADICLGCDGDTRRGWANCLVKRPRIAARKGKGYRGVIDAEDNGDVKIEEEGEAFAICMKCFSKVPND
jgi:hypothetical protein